MGKVTENSQSLGELALKVANEYLEKEGFLIVNKQFKGKNYTIDFICEKDNSLTFINVKPISVSSLDNVSDETLNSALRSIKIKSLLRTIQTYLIHERIGNTSWQFDVLVVYMDWDKRKARVKRIENVIL